MMNWESHWEHVVKTRQTERMAVGKTSELRVGSEAVSRWRIFWKKRAVAGTQSEQIIARCVRAGLCIVTHQKTQGTPFQDSA